MRKPRILILSPPLTAVSGFSTHANQLMACSLAQRYELRHFCVGSEGKNESRLQKLFRLLVSPLSLFWLNIVQRPDIVHINTGLDRKAYWRDLVYLAVVKLTGGKVVNQIHGGPMPDKFFPHNAPLTWLLRKGLGASNAVTVLSLKEYEAYTAFVPEVLVAHIPNAIELPAPLEKIQPSDASQPLRLIYIGRLVREKGVFEALDAIAQLHRSGHRLQFDIAGGGKAEEELRKRVITLGLDQVVHFHGPVFGNEKTRLWQNADVLVFPSYSEGLPYSLLEAMAAGTPAITCPVGAIPDVVQHGVHGLFVPPRDVAAIAGAIASLDRDRALLHRMACAGRARVLEQYTTARLGRDFEMVYEAVLGRDRKPHCGLPPM
jgi:glycosyltransferase involved in cell wall biosynthesis